jgi:CMP/dCMP kinase
MAKITIFGLAGTGTTTVGKKLAEHLGYTFTSTGTIFRNKAESLGLDLYSFEELCNKDPRYDFEIDKETDKFGKENGDFVLESRLGWYFIPDSFKVKVVCDFDTRIKRVAQRDNLSFEDAKEKTLFREHNGVTRYREYYGIDDFGADQHFDLIVDSSAHMPDEILEKINHELALSGLRTVK